MAGICGIAREGKKDEINQMLDNLEHRGGSGRKVIEANGATLGIVYPEAQKDLINWQNLQCLEDSIGDLQFARAYITNNSLTLERDPLGVSPLYFGHDIKGTLYFASEVKALVNFTSYINQVPPGHRYDGTRASRYYELKKQPTSQESADHIAKKLFKYLDNAVVKFIKLDHEPTGCWLSGGLDSSVIAVLANSHLDKLYTFSVGLHESPDILAAREVADYLQTEHIEHLVTFNELLEILPQAVYHLESFDALLVRSSIMNFIVGKKAAKYVNSVFSGEGADELFAGYAYLKSHESTSLTDELIDITNRLHDTALQRVDRSATAHGIVAYVPFLDSDVVNFAFCIPEQYKIRDNIEKWILRKAMENVLPNSIINRTKAKFWKGAGVEERIAQYVEDQISDQEFAKERKLMNGWRLNTKEELFYYRLFREKFGKQKDLDWIGRTKGAPRK
jgi:asparagine synthase (glutamine-hydrolysing)